MKNQLSRYSRKFWLIIVLAALNISITNGQQTVTKNVDAPSLKLNQTLESTIKGGGTHSFQFHVKAGEYARAEVDQKNIDIVVSLFAPDGKLVVEMDGKNGDLWREAVSAVAEKKGTYRVEIKAYGTADMAGSYTVQLAETRPSAPNDRKRLEAEAHLSAGRKFYLQGGAKHLEVVKEYEAANVLWRELGDAEWEGITLVNLGLTYRALAKNEQATDVQTRAMELFQKTKDRMGEGKAFHGLGSSYLTLSQYEKAREFHERALIIRREIKDRSGEGYTLTLLGNLYMYLAQYEKARDYYEQSLIISREIKDRGGEAYTLSGLANVYASLAQYEKTKDYYGQVLIINRETKDRRREGRTLNNLGDTYNHLAQHETARDYFEQALVINREVKDRWGENVTLASLGEVFSYLAQYEKSRDYYEQALIISREIKNRSGEGFALSGLANVYSYLSQYEKARDYYEQALILSREIKNRGGEGEVYRNLLLLSQKLNNPRLAIFYGKQAVNIYQAIRADIKGLDQESQQSFLKANEPTYRVLADILISEGQLPEAQAVLDLLKEEEFKQIVRGSGEPLYTLPYSRTEDEAIKIVDRLATLGRELSDLKAKPKDSLTTEQTKRLSEIESVEIPAANKALRQAIEALSTVAPDVGDAIDLRIKENIQNILPALGKGVVALYTVIGKTTADDKISNNNSLNKGKKKTNNNSLNKTKKKTNNNKTNNQKINVGWILLVTPEFRKAYPIDTANLEQTIFKFREDLRSPANDPQPVAQELYKKLFRQTSLKQKTTLAADLETYLGREKDKTLMWSLDGVLRYVPMAALHDGKGYLVEKYRNVIFNTVSLGSLKDTTKKNWEIVGLGVSTEGTVKAPNGRMLRFLPLKGSESELNSIIKENNSADAAGVFPGTLKINNDFTREALFEGARTGMPVIHISSHFWFNPAQVKTSFLLLGNSGRLELSEFQDYPNLFSNVDFLSLSACDTATGGNANNSNTAATGKAETDEKARELNGKEIEGFAYAAQKLGAKSVMASLAQVSDESTTELMLKFYQIKKEQPELPKGEALRQAQLSLLRGTKFGHPYYWSPFILIGNWL